MNIIPSTFNQRIIERTVLGGREADPKILMPVTCLVLNRSGNLYRNFVFEHLVHQGFEKIIWVESNMNSRNMFPQKRG